MDLLVVVAPAIILVGLLIVGFAAYSLLCAVGRAPQVAGLEGKRFSLGRYFIVYWHWVLSPAERFLVRKRVSPNTITLIALAVSVASGVAIALGHLATGGWLYILSGTLDIIDGRLARATQRTSAAGGFLDSVADRWSEAAVFSGFAWLLRDTNWSLAVIIALAGSMMVSYVRAAGEVRGTLLDGGLMKRPERILVVSAGTLACAGLASVPSTMAMVPTVMGSVLAFVGAGSILTALGRWVKGYRNLQGMERAAMGGVHSDSETPASTGLEVDTDSPAKPTSTPSIPAAALHRPVGPLGVARAGAESAKYH